MWQCGKAKQADAAAVDFSAIQKKAEVFVYGTGVVGGEIVLSLFSDPRSLNPITSTEPMTADFTRLMYEGLVHINGVTLKPEPGLAASWMVSDDGLTWVFSIRPGVVWSDGAAFTAYDVEFTFNDIIYNDSINPNSARDMFMIEGKKFEVAALDSMTVRFTLPLPFAPFLRAMAQEILPKHAYQKYVKDNSFQGALRTQTPPDSMVGTGPFLFESFVPAKEISFKRNPLYWRKDTAGVRLPYLSRVGYLVVRDQKAELRGFKEGKIDYLRAKGEEFDDLKKDEPKAGHTVYRLGPASTSHFLFFNENTGRDPATGRPYVDSVKLGWFRNGNFRRAVACALDKQGMIRAALSGLGYPQWGPMSPSEGYFYNPSVSQYPYDTAKAKSLLAGAGFTDKNHDGVIEDPQGRAVEFTILTNSGNTVRGRLAEAVCKDLCALGFSVHVKLVDFAGLIDRIDNPPYDWDAALLALTGNVEPHFGKNVWQSSGYRHMWFPSQKTPSTQWEARIDSIFSAAVKELDESKRKALYDEWQRIVSEELPFIYTVLPEQVLCISNRFKNVNPSVNGGLLHDIERIYAEDASRRAAGNIHP
jgi:peptide/nickel transport system substrate-binding protein